MGVTQNLYVGGNMNVLTGDVTAANLGTTRDDLCLIVCSPAGARSRSLTALCTHVGSGATGQATTTTTGALITNGGMGVVKNAYIGGILATQRTTVGLGIDGRVAQCWWAGCGWCCVHWRCHCDHPDDPVDFRELRCAPDKRRPGRVEKHVHRRSTVSKQPMFVHVPFDVCICWRAS